MTFMADHTSNITKNLQETKFKDEFHFNIFVAKHIIYPLCTEHWTLASEVNQKVH